MSLANFCSRKVSGVAATMTCWGTPCPRSHATFNAGSMPIIGMVNCSRSASTAADVAVLQAMTTALTPSRMKLLTMANASFRTCSGVFVPYGAFAESPKYRTCSFGRSFAISRTTVMPPNPESNTPIGAVEVMAPPQRFIQRRCRVSAIRTARATADSSIVPQRRVVIDV